MQRKTNDLHEGLAWGSCSAEQSNSIEIIEYTHDEVMQTRYLIGVMSEIENRQARTREI